MGLRIGIDFDDTLTDLSTLITRLARERWDIDADALRASGAPFAEAPEFEQIRALFAEILGSELTLEMEPRPGAVEVMRRLARTHELVIVTARSEAESPFARRWLGRHWIPVHGFVSTNRGPKSLVAREQALAVLLDDLAHNFDDFADLSTVPALYLEGWDRYRPPPAHVRTVDHWHRFEALVEDLAAGDLSDLADAAGS